MLPGCGRLVRLDCTTPRQGQGIWHLQGCNTSGAANMNGPLTGAVVVQPGKIDSLCPKTVGLHLWRAICGVEIACEFQPVTLLLLADGASACMGTPQRMRVW